MRVRFGEFVFDSARRELLASGEPRHLSTKAFALLETLIRNAPRALTKEELYRAVWGEAIVEEVNLANLVSDIRSILGESRKEIRFIKTVHAYGYAFAGELTIDRDAAPRAAQHLYSLYWKPDEFALREGSNVIGRAEDADVTIDSVSVSRRHARIVVDPAGASIEDLGSKNGTFVAGERVEGTVKLADGVQVKLGFVTLTFRASSRAATTATELAPPDLAAVKKTPVKKE